MGRLPNPERSHPTDTLVACTRRLLTGVGGMVALDVTAGLIGRACVGRCFFSFCLCTDMDVLCVSACVCDVSRLCYVRYVVLVCLCDGG